MVNTIEIALAQKMQEALLAYGLQPNEAVGDVRLITSVTDTYAGRFQTGKDKHNIVSHSDHSDSLYVEFNSRRVNDRDRKKVVDATMQQFVLDFIAATGIDVRKCRNAEPEIGYGNGAGGYGWTCVDVANSSTRQGPDRAVDDVWYGLQEMIRNKAKDKPWTERAA